MAVTAQSARLAKTGTGIAGSALTTVGAVLLPIPVFGWIVGGILTAAGAALSVASSKYDVERAAARESMLSQGSSWEFASEFAKVQKLPDADVQKRIDKHTRAFERSGSKADRDRLLAARHALYMRSLGATVDTAIASQQTQIDAEVEAMRTQRTMLVGGAVVVALAIAAVAALAGGRR